MKISSQEISTRNSSSLKVLSALTFSLISLFCGPSSVSAGPLLGSALASFAFLGKTGVTDVPKKNKISGTSSPVENIFVSNDYPVGTFLSGYTLFHPDLSSYYADYTFVGTNVDIGSDITIPIFSATGFENTGAIDQAVNIQSVTAVPEPATLALLGLGLAGLGFARRRYG